MVLKDFFKVFIVILIWGFNFIAIKFGVGHVPPFLLVGLRFIIAGFPAIFFIKKPKTSWKYLVAYALTVGVGQFSLLFYAIKIGMPAGVASVVVQSQAFFTILIERVLYKDRLRSYQVVGLVISALGLVFVSGNVGRSTVPIPLPAFLLTLLAALFWAMSNIVTAMISRDAQVRGVKVDMFSVVVWSSLIPPIPMIAMSLFMDGPQALITTFKNINAISIASMFYLGFGATLTGYGLWTSLMAKYPPKNVAPLSLLVPVIGLIGALIVLGESLESIQWLGCGIVILGLVIFNLYPRMIREKKLSKKVGAIQRS